MTAAPVHHSLNYVELTVSDLDAAQDFYERAFGWQFTAYGPEYAGFSVPGGVGEAGGLALASRGGEKPQPSGGPFVLLYSDDLDQSVDEIRAAGGEIVSGPYAFPGGRRVHFTDPSGNELGVWAER